MAAHIIQFEDAAASFQRDYRVLTLRVKGLTERDIVEQEGLTVAEVEASLIRMTSAASPGLRERYLKLTLERLDKLLFAHHDKAMAGNYNSSLVYLKTINLYCSILGLHAPPQMAPPLGDQPVETTTDQIEAALDFVRRRKNRTIDGEVIEQDGGDAG
jgi:hypothetical protein